MWVLLNGDGDLNYTSVYGPYSTQDEVEEALLMIPAEADLSNWRAEEVLPLSESEV